jgi:branched-chain amino acid transport system substrate-binding protein
MKSRIFAVISLLVVLGLALVVSSCGTSPPEPAPATEGEAGVSEAEGMAGEPYKIGALVSITGGASVLGVPERNTLEMLQAEVNAGGGVQGPDGLMHPVEVFIYDTESEETKAVLAAKKLIGEDQVSIILGPTTSGESLAVVDTVQKAEVPMISMASSKMIVQPVEEHKWIFKTAPNDSLTVGGILDWLKEEGYTKVAWLSINNAYGDSGKVELEAVAPELGLEIVASERMDAGDTDMTAQLTKIRGTDAEALIIYSILPEVAIAVKNQYDLGMDLPLYAVGGAAHPKFVELAGPEAAGGARNLAAKLQFVDDLPDSDPQKSVIKEYNEQYQASFGTGTDMFGGHAYDAFKIALQAMEKAGSDKAAIRDALEGMDFAGCSGVFDWSATDHAGMAPESMVRIEVADGKWQLAQP